MHPVRMTLILLALMVVSSAAWAAPAHSGASSRFFFAGIFSESAGFFARITHTVTEPVGLLLMGAGLIALSIVVRRRAFGRRSR